MSNKCEDNGFEHAWESNSNQFYASYPPPAKSETCKNCGLTRTHMSETKSWIEYSDGIERPGEYQRPLRPC